MCVSTEVSLKKGRFSSFFFRCFFFVFPFLKKKGRKRVRERWAAEILPRTNRTDDDYTARNSSLLLSRAMRTSFRLCTGFVRGSLYWANSDRIRPLSQGGNATLSLLDASLFMASLNLFSASRDFFVRDAGKRRDGE